MALTALLLAVFAHFCADFLLQSDRMVEARGEKRFWPYLIHGLTVAGTLLLALHPFGLGTAAIFAVAVTVAHLVLDWSKDRLCRRGSPGVKIGLFFADQVAHLVILLVLWQWLDPRFDDRIAGFYRILLLPRTQEAMAPLLDVPGANANRILLAAIVYAATMFGGAALLRKVLDALTVPPVGGESQGIGSAERVGWYIGILERGLILTLVLADAVSAAGFVVAAKSVARFKELDNKGFAEYYLIGTLASTLLAVAAGLMLKAVLARI